jgi:hypothetical protein
MTTRSSKQSVAQSAANGGMCGVALRGCWILVWNGVVVFGVDGFCLGSGASIWRIGFAAASGVVLTSQADRAIRTGQLHVLPRFHTRPIDVVVFHGSHGRPGFEEGFPLRCLQRLSFPDLATLLCRWRDNRSTRGPSTPVLSY